MAGPEGFGVWAASVCTEQSRNQVKSRLMMSSCRIHPSPCTDRTPSQPPSRPSLICTPRRAGTVTQLRSRRKGMSGPCPRYAARQLGWSLDALPTTQYLRFSAGAIAPTPQALIAMVGNGPETLVQPHLWPDERLGWCGPPPPLGGALAPVGDADKHAHAAVGLLRGPPT